jgi:hypothetical protein
LRRWKTSSGLQLTSISRALGAARSGDPAAAKIEIAKLTDIEQKLQVPPGSYDWKAQVRISRQIADAWLARADGNNDEALRLMQGAATLDDALEKHR